MREASSLAHKLRVSAIESRMPTFQVASGRIPTGRQGDLPTVNCAELPTRGNICPAQRFASHLGAHSSHAPAGFSATVGRLRFSMRAAIARVKAAFGSAESGATTAHGYRQSTDRKPAGVDDRDFQKTISEPITFPDAESNPRAQSSQPILEPDVQPKAAPKVCIDLASSHLLATPDAWPVSVHR